MDSSIMAATARDIFSDNKRRVILYRAARSESNISGTERLSYAAAEPVELVFFKTKESFEFGPEGLLEKGDCMVFDKPGNLDLERDDKIEADGETFILKEVDHWRNGNAHIFDYGIGYKI